MGMAAIPPSKVVGGTNVFLFRTPSEQALGEFSDVDGIPSNIVEGLPTCPVGRYVTFTSHVNFPVLTEE